MGESSFLSFPRCHSVTTLTAPSSKFLTGLRFCLQFASWALVCSYQVGGTVMKKLKVALLILFLTRTLAGQEPTFQERHPRYRIHVGDVIAFNFSFTPDFNQTVTVQPDGFITLRAVGDIQIEDKTTPEVVEAVRAAYGKVLHDPVITVELKDFEKPYFV